MTDKKSNNIGTKSTLIETAGIETAGVRGPLNDAAQRALAEAEERRQVPAKKSSKAANEIDGRGGLDPARYGDWEKKGIAVDF